jgi:ketosteroid isomerase-like protein
MRFLFIATLFLSNLSATPSEEITNALQQWPKDFNAKDAKAVCGLFAKDLVASYPGIPDRNYEQMCEKLTAAMNDTQKKFQYQAPEIEQVIVVEDLAVVRLIWTLQAGTEVIREKGMDVFRRQNDGSWKIIISYAYPL